MSSAQAPLLALEGPYIRARLIRREKRFIVHAEALDGPRAGQPLTAHLADPGRLPHLMQPGQVLWLTGPFPPPRKLAWSVKLAEVDGGWVALDTQLANRVVPELIARGALAGLHPDGMQREVKRGDARLDLLWQPPDAPERWAEIKTVSLFHPDGHASWPDAPSARGRKHLAHLIAHARQGGAASLIFAVGHPHTTHVTPERAVDPAFADLLAEAADAGVQLLAHRLRATPDAIFDAGPIAVHAA